MNETPEVHMYCGGRPPEAAENGTALDYVADVVEPTDEELVAVESPLEEWDELRVQRFWSAMVAEELGSDEPEPEVEDVDEVPARRTSSGVVLQLVRGSVESRGEVAGGEAA